MATPTKTAPVKNAVMPVTASKAKNDTTPPRMQRAPSPTKAYFIRFIIPPAFESACCACPYG